MTVGALTAGVEKDILSLTAPGILKGLSIGMSSQVSVTATIRIRLNSVLVGTWVTALFETTKRSPIIGSEETLDSIPFDTMTISIQSDITTSNVLAFVSYDLD